MCAGTGYTCSPAQCEQTSTPDGVVCAVTFRASGSPCDDTQATTKNDACDGSGTCAETPFTCSAGRCVTSSTPNGASCDVSYAADGATCDDGDSATRDDTCDGQGGCAGTPFTCVPRACESSSIPNGADCVVVHAIAGTACDDGDACSSGDRCDAAGACAGDPIACEAGEVCVTGTGCESVHCAPCEDGAACGADAQCLTLATGGRCLVSCVDDGDCSEPQTCLETAAGKHCFDPDGDCALPADPGDADTEAGPETQTELESDTGPTAETDTVADPDEREGDTVGGDDGSPDGSGATDVAPTAGDDATRTDEGTDTTSTKPGSGGGCAAGGNPV